jgi:hypothetical protein
LTDAPSEYVSDDGVPTNAPSEYVHDDVVPTDAPSDQHAEPVAEGVAINMPAVSTSLIIAHIWLYHIFALILYAVPSDSPRFPLLVLSR